MEIFLLALAVGALMLGWKLGREAGRQQEIDGNRRIIARRFKDPGAFRDVFGVPGLYFNELDEDAGALVIIQSSDFLRLVATAELADVDAQAIDALKEQLVHKHLRMAKGWTDEHIKNVALIAKDLDGFR